MGVPKTGVKIMPNNLKQAKSPEKEKRRQLKSSGQELDPYPQVINKKIKKKKKKAPFNSETPELRLNNISEKTYHELVGR